MKIHPSALKHGVAGEDAEQAAEWALWIACGANIADLGEEHGPLVRRPAGPCY